MATAKKLPSGNWRVQVYDYTDGNEKKHYRSFTGPTKKAAELLAAQYNASPKKGYMDMTVKEAIDRYITAKTGVLSPASIRGYRQMQKTRYRAIEKFSIYKLTTEDLQKFVSSLTGKLSAKTISNTYGLLSSTLTMFRPEAYFRVTLPKKMKRRKDAPSSDQVAEIFGAASASLKICIALAAFGSLRRGEVCAIKYGDITGNLIYVHADIVPDENHHFIYKEMPKTSDSVRLVRMPDEVIEMIGKGDPDEFVYKSTPDTLTRSFIKLRDRLGHHDIRFHDLRRYYASIGAVLGIPDNYLSDFGGWRRGSGVMKEVYQGVIESEKDKYQSQMADHFSRIISHEMSHENEKSPD